MAPRLNISGDAMQVSTNLDAPSTERIAIVDILRAIALFGIIINHAAMSFLAGPTPDPQFNTFSALDSIVNRMAELLTFGKFFAIFSFLFGLSFAIQLDSANRRGSGFSGRFAWRLMVLLVIGFVHSMFFSGDVLMIYALLGLLLIPSRKLKSRTLIVLGLIFVLNIPGLLLGVARVSAPPPSVEQEQTAARFREHFEQQAKEQYQIKQSGSLSEIIEMNLTQSTLNKVLFMVFSGRLWITFGYFLLGLWAGRVSLFRDTEANRTLFRKVMLWSAPIALVTTMIHLFYPSTFEEATLANVLAYFSFTTQQSTLAAFILSSVTLLYWRRPTGGLLPKLAATGRMGLTTYLMQSVFGVIVFFGIGFGLLGKIGVAASVASGIAFFVFQVLFARWWLHRFSMGPFEWLWRSLTYFKLQPNARNQATSA
jgi:uncharacterized protein